MVREPAIALVLESVGANVRRLRVRRGLTQQELAELSDLDLRFLQKVEAGTTNVGVVILAKLAIALAVPPSTLLRAAKLPKRVPGRPRKRRNTAK